MLHAVVMAGGSGTRFWPASRSMTPKQLLDLAGEQTMIQSTVSRLGELVPPDRVLVVTNQRLVDAIRDQLPQLPPASVIGEPCKRDTAPCIGLAAAWVAKEDPDAIMIVMPADHVITPDSDFQAALRYAASLVEQQQSRLVTFGIKPTYPAESFGYIERDESLGPTGESGTSPPTFRVKQFREKPKAEVAQQYLDSGQFYWNSGIFVWRAKTILDALERHEPKMHAHLVAIAETIGSEAFASTLEREFTAIEGTSIDYAVMERAEEVVVVEAPYQWDDVGSWQALSRLRGTDEDGNTLVGKTLSINTSGTIIRSDDDHLIATLGLKDCIVVRTPDATLVANKHDEESIRQIVKLLGDKGWQEYL